LSDTGSVHSRRVARHGILILSAYLAPVYTPYTTDSGYNYIVCSTVFDCIAVYTSHCTVQNYYNVRGNRFVIFGVLIIDCYSTHTRSKISNANCTQVRYARN